MTIVDHSQDLINYILGLGINLSKPQMRHLLNIVTALIVVEGKKNLSNLNRAVLNSTNRSSVTRFINDSPTDFKEINNKRIDSSINKIIEENDKSNSPIFIIYDDTHFTKSRDSKHIENMDYHYSHLTGRSEWAHTEVAFHAKCNNLSLSIDFLPYVSEKSCVDKAVEFKTKIQLVEDSLKTIKFSQNCKTYMLVDSWYSKSKLLEQALKQGIQTICDLKSNRIIYPQGIKSNLKKFSELLTKSELNLVTVKKKKYFVYRYEGNLKDTENAIVLISFKASDKKLEKPKFILSTDISLSNSEILEYYSHRWDIETSFRYQKEHLGIDHYQMRDFKSIKNFWCLVYLAHNYLILKSNKGDCEKTVGQIIIEEKNYIKQSIIKHVLELKESGLSDEKIINKFYYKVA